MHLRFTIPSVLAILMTALPVDAQLRLHGSNTIGEELAPALVRGWLQRRGYDDIAVEALAPLERRLVGTNDAGETTWVEIHAHGSSTSFRDLDSGAADMGMSSRRIRGEVPDEDRGRLNAVLQEADGSLSTQSVFSEEELEHDAG